MTKPQFIPYFETSRYKVETMVKLAGNVKDKKVADLGAGDGRISIAFAEKGAQVDAFELDKNLAMKLSDYIKNEGLQNKIQVKQEDFWKANFSAYDVICIYPMPDIMEKLKQKIKNEAKPGTKVITNYYKFSVLDFSEMEHNVYLYLFNKIR